MFQRRFVLLIAASALTGTAKAQTYLTTYRADEMGDQPAAICALADGSTVSAGLAFTDLAVGASLMCVDQLGQVEWYQRYEDVNFAVFQDVIRPATATWWRWARRIPRR